MHIFRLLASNIYFRTTIWRGKGGGGGAEVAGNGSYLKLPWIAKGSGRVIYIS